MSLRSFVKRGEMGISFPTIKFLIQLVSSDINSLNVNVDTPVSYFVGSCN